MSKSPCIACRSRLNDDDGDTTILDKNVDVVTLYWQKMIRMSAKIQIAFPYDIVLQQVLMVRLESDLAQVLLAACRGELSGVSLSWSPGSAMVVVMASKGYPGSYKKATIIQNLEEAEQVAQSVKVFHAGTALDPEGNFIATGGRVLGVTAQGKDLEEARDRAYEAVEQINWPGGFFRRDIGWRALLLKQCVTKG